MESTPPHHPTYKVSVSDAAVHKIIASTFPTQTVRSIEAATKQKGFNNRIYYINTCEAAAEQNDQDCKYVLKVSGTNFGPEKTRSEICCLALLQHFCADVPAPRLLAWSEDGSVINIVKHLSQDRHDALHITYKQNALSTEEPKSSRPWILLSRLPGRPFCTDDFKDHNIAQVMKQIASCIMTWRYKLPVFSLIGNFDLAETSISAESDDQMNARVQVSKVLLCTEITPGSLSTRLDYYKARLENEMEKLETSETFKPNREALSATLKQFVQDKLPHLQIMDKVAAQPVFAQYDLCPRNILVSDEPALNLTGIVDFEFAGMFHLEEEFTNIKVSNQGDWPERLEELIEQELVLQEQSQNIVQINDKSFQQACTLIDIANNIAPWWIPSEGDNAEELMNAKAKVLDGLKQLGWP